MVCVIANSLDMDRGVTGKLLVDGNLLDAVGDGNCEKSLIMLV